MSHSHSHADDHEVHHIPYSTYIKVIVTLFILTFITVYVAQFNFGNWNLVVAMLIASIKAGVVGLFFMHLKYENPLIWLYVVFPIVLLFVMLGGLFIDDPTRHVPGKDSVYIEDFAKGRK